MNKPPTNHTPATLDVVEGLRRTVADLQERLDQYESRDDMERQQDILHDLADVLNLPYIPMDDLGFEHAVEDLLARAPERPSMSLLADLWRLFNSSHEDLYKAIEKAAGVLIPTLREGPPEETVPVFLEQYCRAQGSVLRFSGQYYSLAQQFGLIMDAVGVPAVGTAETRTRKCLTALDNLSHANKLDADNIALMRENQELRQSLRIANAKICEDE